MADAVNDPRFQQQSAYNGTDGPVSGAAGGSEPVSGANQDPGAGNGADNGMGGAPAGGTDNGGSSTGAGTGGTTNAGGSSAGNGGTGTAGNGGTGNGSGTGTSAGAGDGAGGPGTVVAGTGDGTGGAIGAAPGAGDGAGGIGGIGGGLDAGDGTGGALGGLGGIGGGLGAGDGTGGGLGGIGGGLGGIGGGLGGIGGGLGGIGGIAGGTGLGGTGLGNIGLGPVEDGLNGVVLGLNGDINGVTSAAGLGNTGRGTTGADETAGLGHLGDSNLITDVINTPTGLLSGNTTPISHIPGDVSDVVTSVGSVPQAVLTDLSSSAVGSVIPGVLPYVAHIPSDIVTNIQPVLNDGLQPILPNTVAGLGTLEAATGLTGNIGDHNLINDVVLTPGAVLSGNPGATLNYIPGDVANTLGGVGNTAQGLVSDLGDGHLLGGNGTPLAGILGNGEASGLLNGAGILPTVAHIPSEVVTNVQPAVNDVVQPILPNTIDGLGGVEAASGLTGNIGDHNLINDVVLTPGAVLDGHPETTLNYIPGDVTHTLQGVGDTAQGLVSDLGDGHLLSGAGIIGDGEGSGGLLNGAGLVPTVAHIPSEVVTSAQPALNDVLHPILPETTGALGGLESPAGLSGNIGDHNLINDVAMTPDAALYGNPGSTLNYIPGDVTHTLQGAGGVAQGLVSDLGDGHLLGGEGAPVTGILGGAEGNSGLLNSVLNSTGLLGPGDGQGSHNLVTVAAGPEDANGGLAVNALTPGGDSSHAVDVNAIQAPSGVPTVANVSLLTDTLHLPTAGGGLTDALSGVLNDSGASHAAVAAAPAPAAAPSMDHFDVGLVPTVTDLVQPQHHALA